MIEAVTTSFTRSAPAVARTREGPGRPGRRAGGGRDRARARSQPVLVVLGREVGEALLREPVARLLERPLLEHPLDPLELPLRREVDAEIAALDDGVEALGAEEASVRRR